MKALRESGKITKEEEHCGLAFKAKRIMYTSAVSILVMGGGGFESKRWGKVLQVPHDQET